MMKSANLLSFWLPVVVLLLTGTTSSSQAAECGLTPLLLAPSTGPPQGGTIVTITVSSAFGCCILSACPGPRVSFGAEQAQVLHWTSTEITVLTPPHPTGAVSVTVENFGVGTLDNAFTYTDSVPALNLAVLVLLAATFGILGMLRLR